MNANEQKEVEILNENENQPVNELEAIRKENAKLEEAIKAAELASKEKELIEEENQKKEQLKQKLRKAQGLPENDEPEKSKIGDIVHATDDYLPPSEAIKNRYPVKGFPVDRKLAYTFYERQIPKEKRNSPNTAYRLKELADNSAKMAELSRRLESSEFVDRGGYGVQRARNWDLYRDHEKEVIKNTAILNIIPLFSEVEIHEKTRLKLGL